MQEGGRCWPGGVQGEAGGLPGREEVTGEASPGARRLKHQQAPGNISLQWPGPSKQSRCEQAGGEGQGGGWAGGKVRTEPPHERWCWPPAWAVIAVTPT